MKLVFNSIEEIKDFLKCLKNENIKENIKEEPKTEEKTANYDIDTLIKATASYMASVDKGDEKIASLLNKFNVQTVYELKENDYIGYVDGLKGLGVSL